MNLEYVYTAVVKCHCYPRTAELKAELRYDFWDQYVDAADGLNRKPGIQEYIGGYPFNYSGQWRVERSKQGTE